MNHAVRSVVRVAVLFFLVDAAGHLRAQEIARIDPRAEKVLHAAATFYAAAQSVSVYIADEKRAPPADQNQYCLDPPWSSIEVKFARPNRIDCIIESGASPGLRRITDGRRLTVYNPGFKKYIVADAPQEIVEAWGFSDWPWLHRLPPSMHQGLQLTAMLLAPEPSATILERMKEIRYIGEEKFGTGRAHRLKFIDRHAELSTMDLWIDVGPKPVVRRAQTYYSQIKMADGSPLTVTIDFERWDFAAKFTAADFVFPIPEGAKSSNAESLFRLFDEDPRSLPGRAVKHCELTLLKGNKVKLAGHLGKEVVILHFWETWQPNQNYNFAEVLKTVAAAAAEFRAQGCAFYAVNYEQDPEAIRAFLTEQKLDIPVAVDRDGIVRAAFVVDDLPTTVVIGKDGKVAFVHVHRDSISATALRPFADRLRNELNEILGPQQTKKK